MMNPYNLIVCVYWALGVVSLFLVVKGVILISTRKVRASLPYLLVGLPLLALVVVAYLIPVTTCNVGPRKRPRCMSNLSQIAKGCIMYSMDSDEAFPPSFAALPMVYISDPKTFVCDASGHKAGPLALVDEWTDYVLITNITAGSSCQLVLAYCKPENHDGKGCNVVFVDGSVVWLNAEDFHTIPCDVVNHSQVSEMPQQKAAHVFPKAASGL